MEGRYLTYKKSKKNDDILINGNGKQTRCFLYI